MSTTLPYTDMAGSSSGSSSDEESRPSTDSSDDSESSAGSVSTSRPLRTRPAWKLLWCSTQDTEASLESLMAGLPGHSTRKSDSYRCTMDHTSLEAAGISQGPHMMRTVLTRCISARCAHVNEPCSCRYKVNTCESSGLVFVYQDDKHIMLGEYEGSPRTTKLTAAEKDFIEGEMRVNSAVTPHVVFTRMCTVLSGPPPAQTQVQRYMKRWRAKHRDDSMQPVIDICARHMYELNQLSTQAGDELLVFYDSICENGSFVPDIGDASDELPFRLGLTCYALLEAYATVQEDPRCITILHVDSTHDLVRQRYNVFILGYSDCCSHFFPLVYYCASQRRAEDVAWCLSYLKRVMFQRFASRFAPQYVMADADNAQYNACTSELPATKILKEWASEGKTCVRFRAVTKKIRRQWFDNPRFANWQAFHTLPGYATTNNPAEQYNRNVKLVNSTSRATPTEMVQLLDQSRIGFLAHNAKFSSITQASKRLKARYHKIKKQGQLRATVLLPVGDLRSQLVLVKHSIPEMTNSAPVDSAAVGTPISGSAQRVDLTICSTQPDTASRNKKAPRKKKKSEFHSDDVNQPIKSWHTPRMQWEGMAANGWIVDVASRACQCRFRGKFNICPHIIEAAKLLGLPCPGFKAPVRWFQTRDKSSRRTQATSIDPVRLDTPDNSMSIPRSNDHGFTPEISFASIGPTTERVGATSAVNHFVERPHSATTYHDVNATRSLYVPEAVRCPVVPDLDGVLAPPDRTTPPPRLRERRPWSAPSRDSPLQVYLPDRTSVQQTSSRRPPHLTLRESCEHTKRRRC